MGGVRRRDSTTNSSTSSSPRSSGHVAFADTLVTGISRQMYPEEHQIAYQFEAHAARCESHCRNPYQQINRKGRLCEEGSILAAEVAKLYFRIRMDDKDEEEVYYKSRTNGQETRIELPGPYNNLISLLWAIDAYGEGIVRSSRRSSPSFHPVSPKASRRSSAMYQESPTTMPYGADPTTYNLVTIEPRSRHHTSHTSRHSKSSRHDTSPPSARPKRYSYEVVDPYLYRYPR